MGYHDFLPIDKKSTINNLLSHEEVVNLLQKYLNDIDLNAKREHTMEKYSFKSQRTLIKDLDNTTETCTQNLPRNRTIRPISGMQKTRPLTALTSIGATSITTKGVTS